MKQLPFFSPTVFNFYHPDHVIEGTTLVGPEFEIFDTSTDIVRINFVNTAGLRIGERHHHRRSLGIRAAGGQSRSTGRQRSQP